MDLLNYKTGKWEEHADDENLATKVGSGEYGLPLNIRIPVVTDDGRLATVPSEKAREAFQEGYRFQTQADRDVSNAKAKDEIVEKHFGSSPGVAAALGVARTYTAGLSDVALSTAGLSEAVRGTRESNPVASMVGEVGGALVPGGAGGLLAKAGQRVATGVKAAVGTGTKSAQLLGRYAGTIAGSAAEGAGFGVGQGVSETALGDPSELVENITAGGLQGALYGGLLGGAFQGAQDVSPLISSVVRAGAGKAGDGISSLARKGYKGITGRAVEAKFGKETGDIFRSAIDDPAGRAALDATGDAAFKEMAAEADQMGISVNQLSKQKKQEIAQLQKQVEKDIVDREARAQAIIKNAPKEIREEVAGRAEQLGYDTSAMIDDMAKQYDSADELFQAQLRANYQQVPGQRIDSVLSQAQKAADALSKSGSRTAQAVGKSIRELIDAEVGAGAKTDMAALNSKLDNFFAKAKGQKPRPAAPDVAGQVSVADEFAIAQRLRNQVDGYKLKPADQEIINKLQQNLDNDVLKNHYIPEISSELQQISARGQILDDLRGQLSTPASQVKKLDAVVNDPIRARAFNDVLNRAEEFYPDAVKLRQGFESNAEKLEMLKTAQQKIRQNLMGSSNGKLSIKDTEDVLNLLGKNIEAKELTTAAKTAEAKAAQLSKMADDIQALKAAIEPIKDASAVDKYMTYARILGKDVREDIEGLQKLSGLNDKIQRLKQLEQATEKGGLGALAMWAMAPKIAAIQKAVSTVKGIGSNPAKSLRTLGAIERVAQNGARTLSDAITKTVDSLVSGKALRITRSGALSSMSMKQQKKDFKHQRDILMKMADPAYAAEYVERRLPAMPNAPGVQASLGSHIINVSGFLRSKLPADETEQFSIIPSESDYEPTDTEMAQFLRYSAAAENPVQVIENIGSLTATPEEIETLTVLYPSIYKRLQDQVVSGITKSGTKLAYPQKLMISEMFDIPTDYSLQPQFISAMQSSYAQSMPDNQGGRPAGGGNAKIKLNLDVMETVATPAQRITNK